MSLAQSSDSTQARQHGVFDSRIRILIHSETGFRYIQQIKWPFRSKRHEPWQINNSDIIGQV